ncbi:uncharacterized protein LOC123315910 [Coccinella septempunctata]|uniref:uncharacterized protein LOC123315910 n=1 Tax=Coccinella septempunctata TaxID=41139 RepID=UPI001D06D395|nr:uncharacterized protein LOC123315910 [Coccinella septempunctata]
MSRAELENIKASCFPHFTQQEEQNDQNEQDDQNEQVTRRSSTRIRRSGLFIRSDENNAIEEQFLTNLLKYSCIAPGKRPKIPRLQHSKHVLDTVKTMNLVLSTHLDNVESLTKMVDVVYAAAVTVCENHGENPKEPHKYHRPTEPPWKVRLESRIVFMRKKIGVMHTYLSSPSPSNKTIKAVRKLASEYRVKRRDPEFKDKINIICDSLKQKIKALGNRIRRYNERTKRYKNNRLFFHNPKQFFRNLGEGEVMDNNHLNHQEAHKFWSDVWSGSVAHDNGAYWIDEAQSQIPKTQMDSLVVTESDIVEALKRSNNWASPGADGLHNYWWKQFTCVHKKLAFMFQEALSDPSRDTHSVLWLVFCAY